MSLFAVLVSAFALFALSRVWLRFREGKSSLAEMLFWAFLWVCLGVLAWVPQVTAVLSNLGIQRPADVLIYASIVLIMYLIFRLYVKLNSLEQEITKLVREIAKRK